MWARDFSTLLQRVLGLGETERASFLEDLRRDDSLAADVVEALLAAAGSGERDQASSPVSTSEGDPATEVLQGLERKRSGDPRYRIEAEVARGGQGAVLRVWDPDLRRSLAMKVILDQHHPLWGMQGRVMDRRTLWRFLEEAQVTGRLDHPGIVPVHELGLDEQGRVYFTMKLVEGQDLKQVFRLLRDGKQGWTQTRALNVMLKVCDAMAYAHSKGVLHRDLKPANVMVGRFGEVFVMDWGLARVLDGTDERDLRVRMEGDPLGAAGPPGSGPDARAGEPDDAPLVTMDGDVLGTPCYMSPEQARGDLASIGPQTDVYAVGSMLYHLIAGRPPYTLADKKPTNFAILRKLAAGPPARLDSGASDTPPELIAICEKAMQRDPEERYTDMAELAEDLRAFLENRVVGAYRTGAVAELRKWVQRNRGLALSIALVGMLSVGGLAGVSYVQAGRRVLAEEKAEESLRVWRLSSIRALEELQERARALWPAYPGNIDAYQEWLADAEGLVAGMQPDPEGGDPGHLRQLATLRETALPWTVEEREASRRAHPRFVEWLEVQQQMEGLRSRLSEAPSAETDRLWSELVTLEKLREELESEVSLRREWNFAQENDRWWHDQLSYLVAGIDALGDEEAGLIAGTSAEHGWGIERRLEFAQSIEEQSIAGPQAQRRWSEARAAIARHPAYGGLDLAPQLGLLPIEADSASGLWEFWHIQSGSEPLRDRDGRLVMQESMGVVLVLVPGGTFWMGSQSHDPLGPNYDPHSDEGKESPVHRVTLDPFFLSKFEMTQAQWMGFSGSNPSSFDARKHSEYPDQRRSPHSLLYPVENVSWTECRELAKRMGLTLPTEGQWEYATRAGTDSVWWVGEDELLGAAANLADRYAEERTSKWICERWNDGFMFQSPVASFLPNAFGLHDVHGNLWEWCLDGFERRAYGDGRERHNPLIDPSNRPQRVGRGGGYDDTAKLARSAERGGDRPDHRSPRMGLRPARAIER